MVVGGESGWVQDGDSMVERSVTMVLVDRFCAGCRL